jgi:polyhydroxyalkanoate synthesis regulator phasin
MKRRALKGAVRSQLARGLAAGELGDLETHQDAERWLQLVGEEVATGRLGHQEGRTIVSAVREWVKAHTDGALAQELEKLRDQLEEVKKRKLTAD